MQLLVSLSLKRMNVDAAYTIEINGTKHTLTHSEAKELYRKLGVFLGDRFSEIGRYGNGPYTVPCSNPDEPWKLPPVTCGGNEKPEAVLAPVGIPLTGTTNAHFVSGISTVDPFSDCGCDTYPTTPTGDQKVTIQGYADTQAAFKQALKQFDPGTQLRVHHAIYGDGMP